MNELEKYKNKEAIEHANKLYDKNSESCRTIREVNLWDNRHNNFKEGFDAAIALDLPVKFVEFIRKYVRASANNEYMWNWKGVLYTDKQLYKYWLDNIYKP